MPAAFLFVRLLTLISLLNVSHFASLKLHPPHHISAPYEQIATQSYSPHSAITALHILDRIASPHPLSPLPARMLFTFDEQRQLFAKLRIHLNETQLHQLEQTPDVCLKMRDFMAFVFDSAAQLLKHGVGWERNCMRAFQQVVHMRAVLSAVLFKMNKAADSDMSDVVCVDKIIIAMYGWLRGTLIGLARAAGTYQGEVGKSSAGMEERLEMKRKVVMETRMDEAFDVGAVKPVPGKDFPRVKGLRNCFGEDYYTVDEGDDEDIEGDDDDYEGRDENEDDDDGAEEGAGSSGM